MDFCRNLTAAAGEFNHHQDSSIDDLFPVQNTEVDVSLEWLSVFVEDCLSSTGNGLPVIPPPPSPPPTSATAVVQNSTSPPLQKPPTTQKPQQKNNFPKFAVPSKARTKRIRRAIAGAGAKMKTDPLISWSSHMNTFNQNLNLATNDPPLLQQAYWLADSELIVTKNEENKQLEEVAAAAAADGGGGVGGGPQQQGRRCTHCLSQRTPQWRAGPLGPKTLCNACGVRYKSGRLLPEYRPAKSPTFVSYLHSNSHKKVLEMRHSSIN